MLGLQLLPVLLAIPAVLAHSETTLGVFVFHRHGDRTAKAWSPTRLTELGQHQVHSAGDYFRAKYIEGHAAITSVSEDVVVQSQINVEAPADVVLQNSAQAFLQGLYPPVSSSVGTQTLANGTKVFSPMNLVPVNAVSSAIKVESETDPENVAWLQGISGCTNAETSSGNYFQSAEFKALEESTRDFYQSLAPVISGTFDKDYASFKNAYSIYDLINVATINNATIPSSELLTNETMVQLRTLADKHQFGLAYNSSEPIRAIAGSTLAAQIVQHLDETIASKSAMKFGIQFGAYASFLSFFGLAQLPKVSDDFTGIVDYASAMSFELLTMEHMEDGSYPAVEDINVRFLLSNGSAGYIGQKTFPLFGQKKLTIPYTLFKSEMEKFAVGEAQKWCTECGVTTGNCAAYAGKNELEAKEAKGHSSGLSLPLAGLIGALVALAVVLGVQTIVMLVGGFTLVSKRMMAQRAALAEKEGSFVSA